MLSTRSTSPTGSELPVCVNPACFRWGTSLLEFATAASAAGFERVEVSIQQALALAEEIGGLQVLAARLNAMNLKVEQFSGLLPAGPVLPAPLLVDEAEWHSAWISMDERLHAAAVLGCGRAAVVCNPRTDLPAADARSVAVARLGMLADRAAKYSVSLAVELIGVRSGLDAALDGRHRFVADLAGIIDLIDQVNHPRVGLLLDTCHAFASGTTPDDIQSLCHGLVEFVQISDVPAGVDPVDMRDDLRCPPGEGTLNLPAFLDGIADSGYGGPVSIELFSPAIWSLDPFAAAKRLYAAAARGLGEMPTGNETHTQKGMGS